MSTTNTGDVVRALMSAIDNVQVGQSGKVTLEVHMDTTEVRDEAKSTCIKVATKGQLFISHFKIHTDLTGIIENGNF